MEISDEKFQATMDEFRRKERANWSHLIPQITFVLYLRNAIYKRASIEEIGGQALLTYPDSFITWVGKRFLI